MMNPTWLDELQALAARFASLGIGPDLCALTFAEAWALLRYLQRLAGGAND
jgi:hypothetical protein